jgi:ribosomal protein S6
MKAYELMVILRADFPVTDEKDVRAFIAKLTGGATIDTINIIGKKFLAYPIKKMGVPGKQQEGIYILATLKSDNIQVGKIEKEVSMGNDVLRYLLTVLKEAK